MKEKMHHDSHQTWSCVQKLSCFLSLGCLVSTIAMANALMPSFSRMTRHHNLLNANIVDASSFHCRKKNFQYLLLYGRTNNNLDDENIIPKKKEDGQNAFGGIGNLFHQVFPTMQKNMPPIPNITSIASMIDMHPMPNVDVEAIQSMIHKAKDKMSNIDIQAIQSLLRKVSEKTKDGMPKAESYSHVHEFDVDLANEIEDALRACSDLDVDVDTAVIDTAEDVSGNDDVQEDKYGSRLDGQHYYLEVLNREIGEQILHEPRGQVYSQGRGEYEMEHHQMESYWSQKEGDLQVFDTPNANWGAISESWGDEPSPTLQTSTLQEYSTADTVAGSPVSSYILDRLKSMEFPSESSIERSREAFYATEHEYIDPDYTSNIDAREKSEEWKENYVLLGSGSADYYDKARLFYNWDTEEELSRSRDEFEAQIEESRYSAQISKAKSAGADRDAQELDGMMENETSGSENPIEDEYDAPSTEGKGQGMLGSDGSVRMFVTDAALQLAQSLDLDIYDIFESKKRGNIGSSYDSRNADNFEQGVVQEQDVRNYYERMNDMLFHTLSSMEEEEQMQVARHSQNGLPMDDPKKLDDDTKKYNDYYAQGGQDSTDKERDLNWEEEDFWRKFPTHHEGPQSTYQRPIMMPNKEGASIQWPGEEPPNDQFMRPEPNGFQSTNDFRNSKQSNMKTNTQAQYIEPDDQYQVPPPLERHQWQQQVSPNPFRRNKKETMQRSLDGHTDFQRGIFGAVNRNMGKDKSAMRSDHRLYPSRGTKASAISLSGAEYNPQMDPEDLSFARRRYTDAMETNPNSRRRHAYRTIPKSPSTPYSPLPFQQMPQDKFKQPYQEKQKVAQSPDQIQPRSPYDVQQRSPNEASARSFKPVFQQRPLSSYNTEPDGFSSIPDNDKAYCTNDALVLAEKWGINLRNVSPVNPDAPITVNDVQLFIDTFNTAPGQRGIRRKLHHNNQNEKQVDGIGQKLSIVTNDGKNYEKVSDMEGSSTVEQVKTKTASGPADEIKMLHSFDEKASDVTMEQQGKLGQHHSHEKQLDERLGKNVMKLKETTQKVASSLQKSMARNIPKVPGDTHQRNSAQLVKHMETRGEEIQSYGLEEIDTIPPSDEDGRRKIAKPKNDFDGPLP